MKTTLTLLALALALVLGLAPTARADLIQWSSQVSTGTPSTFVGTNLSPIPTTINIGSLSGDITYEFIVNGNDSNSSALLGLYDGSQGQGIKFEQFFNTNQYGVTKFGVADYTFGVPTAFGSAVHLTFVVNSGAGTTALFVNGVDTGATAPLALTLNGTVGVGGVYNSSNNTFFDVFNGNILGVATYDAALGASEIQAHANAFFAPAAVPEPSSLVLAGFGITGLAGLAWRRRKSAAA